MLRFVSVILLVLAVATGRAQQPMVSFEQASGFCLANEQGVAALCVDDRDNKSVVRAVGDLAADVERVTGQRPSIVKKAKAGAVVIGTIGQSRLIDQMVRKGQLSVDGIRGQWESFVIQTVAGQLVIAGSDRRGTIYGIYELSKQIGVSPWYWWADVPVQHHDVVYVREGRYVTPSPTVRYRGIFINDEDWGLKPWSATNYEKDLGDIGPKTYARVCELLLRLRANMLAPAMHSCTGAFYSHPESKVVCDSYGIVITTSHCEPLLLNNAAESEWKQEHDGDWNYKTNRETIYRKWDNRLAEAARYENIYTVAMRGVHDAGLRGNLPMNERVPLIEKVIADQRELLKKHRAYTPFPSKGEAPQIFVPYKETMDIYENGLRVPDDITLVWVDDNYGYMKRVSSPVEQKRSGRSGIYYHLSYLGAPHDYLWLNTTPPVLMYEELKKAYDTGADRYWLLNVGDIKPMEPGIQTFMDMAWNVNAFDMANVNRHQSEWLAGTLNLPSQVSILQSILDTYYRLAWSRKPEYMGWEYQWDDNEHTGLKSTEFSFSHYDEAQHRLADYQRISDQVERLASLISPSSSCSFFELIQFPVQAAYQMNRKFLMAQLNQEMLAGKRYAEANWAARQMEQAYDSIESLNRRYNEQPDGKWRGMMALSTSFTPTAQYYQKPQVTYTEGAGEKSIPLVPFDASEDLSGCYLVDLRRYSQKDAGVQLVEGLGYDWHVVQLQQGNVSYQLPAIDRDSVDIFFYAVPFWPLYAGKSNRIGFSVDGGEMQVFENKFKEYDRTWKDQVMRNGIGCRLHFAIDPSKPSHTLTIHTVDSGQMVQRVIADWGGLQPCYIGPKM